MVRFSQFATILTFTPVMIGFMLTGELTSARELRPSDHGLVFQNSPPSPEMMSFFIGNNSSPGSSTSSGSALPKAMNSSDSSPSSWWRGTAGGGGRDHVREALMVASLVCGITGVILLLVASAMLFLFKYRKRTLNQLSRDMDHINNNKLELVIRNP